MFTKDEQLKAAYALNLCMVSISQIIDYNDINILEQEYENILNNLDLEQMPKDDVLLDSLNKILDTITYFKISEGDKNLIDVAYQAKMKNAIWAAIPNMGMIFASGNPVAMAVTLAAQVGVGYMNYRRNRAEYQAGKDEQYWQLRRGAIDQLNGLKRQLFETAWKLSKKYQFPDEFRLTENQIKEYNTVLMETNPLKCYTRLEMMQDKFTAYPQFWYQIGSTANSICHDPHFSDSMKEEFRNHALQYFEQYRRLNRFNLLRNDVFTSAWALEYIDLLNLQEAADHKKAIELAEIAEKYAGNATDILELCAYAHLKTGGHEKAARLLKLLVIKNYNAEINARILSGLYIQKIQKGSKEARRAYEELQYLTDKNYLLSIPTPGEEWVPKWAAACGEEDTAATLYSPDLLPGNEGPLPPITHTMDANMSPPVRFHRLICCIGDAVGAGGLGEPLLSGQTAEEQKVKETFHYNTHPVSETVVEITKLETGHLVFTTYALYWVAKSKIAQIPYTKILPTNIGTQSPTDFVYISPGEAPLVISDSQLQANALENALYRISTLQEYAASDMPTQFIDLPLKLRISYLQIVAAIIQKNDYPLHEVFRLAIQYEMGAYWTTICAASKPSIDEVIRIFSEQIPYPNERVLREQLLTDICIVYQYTKGSDMLSAAEKVYFPKLFEGYPSDIEHIIAGAHRCRYSLSYLTDPSASRSPQSSYLSMLGTGGIISSLLIGPVVMHVRKKKWERSKKEVISSYKRAELAAKDPDLVKLLQKSGHIVGRQIGIQYESFRLPK